MNRADRRKVFGSILLTLVLALAACGAQPPAAPTESVATQPPAPAPTAAPMEIRVGVAADPVSMDPRVSIAQSGFAMLRHAFEPLVFRASDMSLVPVLAESWSRPDPLTWQFNLRKGVKFHNGEDFDAEAVKYTIESYMNPDNAWVNTQFAGYISVIEGVEVKDPHTVLLHTSKPSNALVNNLALIAMLPKEHGAASGELFTNAPIGTGPWRIIEYTPNSRMLLEKFDGYWGQKPKIDKIEFRILPENATRVAALESGELHLINNLPTDTLSRIESNPDLQVLSTSSNRVIHVGLEFNRPPFDDVRVRQAMNYATDKQAIVEDLLGGYPDIATGPMHPSVAGFPSGLTPYDYNPEKAKQLLEEAGYGDGITVKFGYPTGRYLMDKQVGEAIIGQWEQIGITIEPETAEWGTFFNNRATLLKYDAWLYGFGAVTSNPDYALQWFGRGRKWGGDYENPAVDELLSKADAEVDQAKAIAMYEEACRIIWDEAAWVFLYYQPDLYGASKKLQGFEPRTDEYFLLFNASLSQ